MCLVFKTAYNTQAKDGCQLRSTTPSSSALLRTNISGITYFIVIEPEYGNFDYQQIEMADNKLCLVEIKKLAGRRKWDSENSRTNPLLPPRLDETTG
ncbi:MAG: hypothetical protein ICPDIFCJ_00385 [Sodalis sp. Ppy]|nr:hypothetical protein [Sodalis sp. Ppy]